MSREKQSALKELFEGAAGVRSILYVALIVLGAAGSWFATKHDSTTALKISERIEVDFTRFSLQMHRKLDNFEFRLKAEEASTQKSTIVQDEILTKLRKQAIITDRIAKSLGVSTETPDL